MHGVGVHAQRRRHTCVGELARVGDSLVTQRIELRTTDEGRCQPGQVGGAGRHRAVRGLLAGQDPDYAALARQIVAVEAGLATVVYNPLAGGLLTGRYRRPVEEERVFLFIDLAGSTAYAEKHGDLRMQEYLGRLFATIADPVMRYRGSIDDYIGDAAVITWPFDRATNNAACIHCVFDILEMIDADATRWQKEFGEVPRLRAALHGGTIVAAEIGLDRHKITYFGDTVNTTARLEGFCKTLGHQVLISTDLARKMRLPHYVRVEDLGEHAVRGRGHKLGVLSLRAGSAAPQLASTAAE